MEARRISRIVLAALLWVSFRPVAAFPAEGASAGAASPAGAAKMVNLNTASPEELVSLPGIGPALAEAIVARRKTTPFARVEDLGEIKGIGSRLVEQLRDKVTIGSGTDTAVTSSSAQGATNPSGSGKR